MSATYELQVDATQTLDLVLPAALIPVGAIQGDLILIRPVVVGKGKGKDRPLLYKVQDASSSAVEDTSHVRRSVGITVSSVLAAQFDWIGSGRTLVELDLVLAPPPTNLTASYAEIHFIALYLSRPDMLRLTLSLASTVIYSGQRVTLPGSAIRLTVGAIFNQDGKRIRSAFVDGETKIAFRSSSARTYVFVEVSEEMWQFEDDGSMLYEKCEVFLQELFKNWKGGGKGKSAKATNHTVSIVLYGRVIYEDNGEGEESRAPLNRNSEGVLFRDFYKVLTDLTPLLPITLAQTVAKEIRGWQHHVLLRTRPSGEQKRAGRIAFAHESNILEATNLALNLFEEHWIDRDLQRTGIALLVVTAGTTLYHVDKSLLRLTTERLLWHGVGLDLISLSRTPLHTVPLFSFRSQEPTLSESDSSRLASEAERDGNRDGLLPDGQVSTTTLPDDQRTALYFDAPPSSKETSIFYLQASFVFCSFFGFQLDKPYRIDRFMPRARCYELFSQGVGEQVPIAIPLLPSADELAKDEAGWTYLSEKDRRQARRERYDARAVGAQDSDDITTWNLASGTTISGTSAASLDQSDSDSGYRMPTSILASRRRIDITPQLPLSALPPLNEERGRERRMSEGTRIPSSTRSRTPMGRPARPPSLSGSVKTVSSRPPATFRAATPSLISRLTAQATVIAPPTSTPVTSTRSSSWLGLFRGASTPKVPKAAPVPVTLASSLVQKVDAEANKALALDTHLSPLSRASSIKSPVSVTSPITSSRRSSDTIASQARPTLPISIGNKAVLTREADLSGAGRPSSVISIAKFAPVKEVIKEEAAGNVFESRLNPSKVGKKSAGLADQERRWSSIFIRHSNDQRSVNWTSICTPACLPITTDYLPPAEALASLYSDYRYSVALDQTSSSMLLHADPIRQSIALELVQELISQRLAHGFQICTRALAFGITDENTSKTIVEVLQDVEEGEATAMYLSISDQIHRLAYDAASKCVVVKILRKRRTWNKQTAHYAALIWTPEATGFDQTSVDFPYPRLIEPGDWEHLDRIVAGVEVPDLRPTLIYWRTRLVLLPGDGIPDREFLASSTKGIESSSTDEEINLVGFNTLMELLEAARWTAPGTEREATPTEITDLSPAEWALAVALRTPTLPLAQSSDRPSRWLRRGAKEEPGVSAGLSLNRERTFSPGRTPRNSGSPARQRNISPDKARRSATSPSRVGTPLRALSPSRLTPSAPSSPALNSATFATLDAAPDVSPDGPIVQMSHCTILDLDPGKKSLRAERVFAHFDRSHNPRAAYHIELTWLAGSGKVIDSAIQSWSRIVARYGLRLCEVSTRSVGGGVSPFSKPRRIEYAIKPPVVEVDSGLDLHHYSHCLLTHLLYLLDMGAPSTFSPPASSTAPPFKVAYSYRRTPTDRSQYIHRSGTALVAVLDEDAGVEFVPNRIYLSHAQTPGGVTGTGGGGGQEEQVLQELQRVCSDRAGLEKLWQSFVPRVGEAKTCAPEEP